MSSTTETTTEPTTSQPARSQRDICREHRKAFEAHAIPLRAKWGVTEPQLGKIPQWIRTATNAAIKRGEIPRAQFGLDAWSALYHVAHFCGGTAWLDHFGKLKLGDGSQVLISEPYQLHEETREHLQRFCDVLGLSFTVQKESWWNPGSTLRITISQKQKG